MIFITSGDPYSINLEILAKSLREDPTLLRNHVIVVCGPKPLIVSQSAKLELGLKFQRFSPGNPLNSPKIEPGLYLHDTAPLLFGVKQSELEQPASNMGAALRGKIALSALYGFEQIQKLVLCYHVAD